MTLINCITNGIEEGNITREQGAEAADLFTQLEAEYATRMAPGQASAKAGQDTFDALEYQVLQRKRRKLLAYQNWKQITKNFDEYKNGADPAAAAVAHFVPKEGAKFSNIEMRTQAVTNAATRVMYDVLGTFRKNLIGSTRKKAQLKDMVREIFGEDTGSASAKELAASWSKSAEYLRQRFNAAGGAISKRLDWGLPQFHDTLKVRKVPYNEWANFIRPKLNLNKMKDEQTGLPFTEARLEIALRDVYETIRQDGMNKPPSGVSRAKSIANRHTDHRFLVFNTADDWMAYQKEFGNIDAFDVMMGHISNMSREIAMLEILGPNPTATVTFMKQSLMQRAAGDIKKEDAARSAANTVDSLFNYLSGRSLAPINTKWGNVLAGVRQLLQSAQLGAASIAAITDVNFQRIARSASGLPQTTIISDYLKQLNPLSVEEKGRLAIRMGLIAEGWMTIASAQQRYVGDLTGPEFTRRVADFVMKASLLSPLTNAGKWAFGMEFYGTLADNIGKRFDELDPTLRNTLEKYSIGSDKWDIMRSTELYDHKGAKFLRPEDIEFREDINPRLARDLATRVMEMIETESQYAVPSTTAEGRTWLYGDTRAGTVSGEVMRSFGMYKGFGVSLVNFHMMRGMSQKGMRGKGKYFADLLISTTLMGALAMQLKEMSKGRDPRPMTDREFWMAAMLQGGGLGIYGDFLFADVNRFDRGLPETIAGPVFGFGKDAIDLTVGNLYEAATGQDTKAASELIKFAGKYTPGASLWYMRLALERMVLDQMRLMADPKARQKFRQIETRYRRDSGQQYWWRPGRPEPSRKPNVENILAERQ
jgi:hypothetical protein